MADSLVTVDDLKEALVIGAAECRGADSGDLRAHPPVRCATVPGGQHV